MLTDETLGDPNRSDAAVQAWLAQNMLDDWGYTVCDQTVCGVPPDQQRRLTIVIYLPPCPVAPTGQRVQAEAVVPDHGPNWLHLVRDVVRRAQAVYAARLAPA